MMQFNQINLVLRVEADLTGLGCSNRRMEKGKRSLVGKSLAVEDVEGIFEVGVVHQLSILRSYLCLEDTSQAYHSEEYLDCFLGDRFP